MDQLGPCCVCGEALPPRHYASCEICTRLFHLRMTEDEEAKDCGQVYLDDQMCTLALLCSPCYMEHIMPRLGG